MTQFFEKNEPISPRKKQLVDADAKEHHTGLTQDGYENAMPGYHESEDRGDEFEDEDDGLDGEGDTPDDEGLRDASGPSDSASIKQSSLKQSHSKPASTNAGTRHTALKPSSSAKPISGVKRSRSASVAEGLEDMSCPICSRTMRTDNRGLNEHIDFCLSKGAIREAQAMASRSKSPIEAQGSTSKGQGATKKRKVQRRTS